ncbi:polysaccharide biosynthesis tyrosine autokinase [Bradyrhizobium sp. URHA0013]|uniref:polysaccharide biosynthesis tyrosine autokinase n=1 Tax=Bradyrhizobium sp. URHA0013 TaxID=1380352 RepID=UPI0004BA3597|nr:polysaccharide biosynthesis tyrosine autokinase [Bradyrhizobium sp. URHA0013]
MTFERLLDIVRRQWPLITYTIIGAVAVVILYLLTASPMYTATASILMDTRQAQLLNKASDAANATLIDPGFVESQVEIITSENLIRGVVNKLNLTKDPEFVGPPTGILATVVGTVSRLFSSNGPPSKEQLEQTAVLELKKNLKVERVGQTYVLNLSFRSLAADKAAQVANAISDEYVVGSLEAKYQSTKRASEWLQNRSAELQAQAITSDRAVQTFKAENGIVGTSRGLVNEQQLADVNTQLIQARAATAEAKARLDRIKQVTTQDLAQPTVTDALNNPVITRLRAQFLDLQAQYADWSNKYGKDHQATQNIASKMQDLKTSIRDEVNRIADAYRSDYEIAKSREVSLESGLKGLVTESGSTAQAQVKLRNLESAADTYRTLYNNFLQKLQEATQNESFPISESRVIATAVTPDKKSSPKTALVLLGGIIAGLCFGLGGACAREMLSQVIRTPTEIENEIGLRCLGTLPDVGDGRDQPWSATRASVYAVDHPFSRFAESLRSAKTAIDVARLTKEMNVVGIVSSLPKEGKTTVAANLAHLVAMAGHKTLLIDGDLHTQSLTKKLAPEATYGLLEALSDSANFERYVSVSKKTNLSLLPAVVRSRLTNSSDIMASREMATLLGALRQKYAYIFIDLPPILPVTDAKAVGHLVDSLVYVVEWGKTRRSAVQEAVAEIEGFSSKIVGVLLNRANPKVLKRIESYKGRHYSDYYVEAS